MNDRRRKKAKTRDSSLGTVFWHEKDCKWYLILRSGQERRVWTRRLAGRETVYLDGTWKIHSPIGILGSGTNRRSGSERRDG